jgi:hypothetical protein
MSSTNLDKPNKLLITAKVLNIILLVILLASCGGFISFMNLYGAFLALITALIAYGCVKHNRWAYFGAAAWGLACFQLAKQGLEFEAIKHYVIVVGIVIIPLALFLHEMLAKPARNSAQISGNQDSDERNMPK